MVFEPTNEIKENVEVRLQSENDKKYTYLYMHPNSLPKYIKEFAHEDDESCAIIDGPECCTCHAMPQKK